MQVYICSIDCNVINHVASLRSPTSVMQQDYDAEIPPSTSLCGKRIGNALSCNRTLVSAGYCIRNVCQVSCLPRFFPFFYQSCISFSFVFFIFHCVWVFVVLMVCLSYPVRCHDIALFTPFSGLRCISACSFCDHRFVSLYYGGSGRTRSALGVDKYEITA